MVLIKADSSRFPTRYNGYFLTTWRLRLESVHLTFGCHHMTLISRHLTRIGVTGSIKRGMGCPVIQNPYIPPRFIKKGGGPGPTPLWQLNPQLTDFNHQVKSPFGFFFFSELQTRNTKTPKFSTKILPWGLISTVTSLKRLKTKQNTNPPLGIIFSTITSLKHQKTPNFFFFLFPRLLPVHFWSTVGDQSPWYCYWHELR